MPEYIAAYACDGLGIGMMLMLLVTNREHISKSRRARFLLYMIVTTLISCIGDSLAFALDGKPGLGISILLYVVNSVLYLDVVLNTYFWLRLECECIGTVVNKTGLRLLTVIDIVGVLLLVVNLFYPLVFTLENNVYVRGDFYYFYVCLGGLNAVYALAVYYVSKKRGSLQIPFYTSVFIVPLLVGMVVQSLFYGVSVLDACIALSVTGVSSSIKNDLLFLDSLTRIYNQHYLKRVAKRYDGKTNAALTGILADVNDFRRINDTLGHDAGDRALAAIAGILDETVKDVGTAVRYGGDEFLLLINSADPETAERMIRDIEARCGEISEAEFQGFRLSLSIGSDVYHGAEQSFDDFLKTLNALMYENKQEYRRRNDNVEAVNVKLGAITLSPDILVKANIGLWAFELDEGQEPRMYVDNAMLGLIGLTEQIPPEETYHAWYDHIDAGSYALVADAVEKMVSGEHAEVQYPWHHPNGQTMIVRCGGVRNPEYTGGVRIEGTHQDVTETLHFDEQETRRVLERERSLANQQRQLRSFGDMVNAALWSLLIDADNRIVGVNWSDEFRRMLGYEPTEADFPNVVESWSSRLIDEDRKRALVNFDESIRSRNFDGFAYDIEYRLMRKSGEVCWYHAVGRMSDEGSGIRKMYGIIYDISADKELEQQRQQLAQALDLAESASRAKTEFLFNMSHDIRTPMNAILGYANLALHHREDGTRVHESLEKIRVSGGHLLNLINDILEMSRIEAGKMELSESPVNMYEVAEGVTNMSRALAINKDISFETVFGELQNPYFYADELHINQVVINLISNAIKYTPAGGTVVYRIEQLGQPTDGVARYRFTVTDNGIGMSEAFQEHLFESFARENTATVSRQEGAGLGLSIVKKIIDLAGGTIAVRSKKGEGSVFTVELPFRLMDAAAIESYQEQRSRRDVIETDTRMEGKRVLVAEDNEMNREISVDILTEVGLETETAEDGAEALKMVSEKGTGYYDYILMDIQMPVMDGYEATAAIRKLPGGAGIPIIALSANAFREDIDRSLTAGMNAHVAKPIDIRNLLDTMKHLTR